MIMISWVSEGSVDRDRLLGRRFEVWVFFILIVNVSLRQGEDSPGPKFAVDLC